MSKIRSKNTKPELLVRSLLFKNGYRFRIHRRDLPGAPDIVLKKYKAVIFVHGCFWHYHAGCRDGKVPKTNTKFWKEKLDRNVTKDKKHQNELNDKGWKVLVIWECEIKREPHIVLKRLLAELR